MDSAEEGGNAAPLTHQNATPQPPPSPEKEKDEFGYYGYGANSGGGSRANRYQSRVSVLADKCD